MSTEAQFYNAQHYTDADGEPRYVGRCAIKLGEVVVGVVDGTIAANPHNVEPIAMNFEAYMKDLLPTEPVVPMIVWWDEATNRYV